MSNSLPTWPAPAKLNLFLHINGRRADGYHDLQTIFQLLDYGDDLRFSVRDDGELHLRCDTDGLNTPDNLVLKAARALQQQMSGPSPGVDIDLYKRIPAGAGLGGGSSDAATTLVALNHLWQAGLSISELAALGATLGADVPVFVHGQSAWAEGIGDQLTPIILPKRWFVVLTPDCHVSTARVFSHEQLTRDTKAIRMAAFLAERSRNDCEALVRELYPPVDAALEWLSQFTRARMTGTGASVFAAFDEEAIARAVLEQLPDVPAGHELAGLRGFVACGINQSGLSAYQTSGMQNWTG